MSVQPLPDLTATTAHDLSTSEGLAAYRATFLPPIYRDELPVPPHAAADALTVTVHLPIKPARHLQGREACFVLWTASYHPCDTLVSLQATFFDQCSLIAGYSNAADVPAWAPRPPATWLALAAEMWGEVA